MYKIKVRDKEFKVKFNENSFDSGKINKQNFDFDIIEVKKNSFHLIKDNQSFCVDVIFSDYENKKFVVKIDGVRHEVNAQDDFDILLRKMGMSAAADVINDIKAPMPGKVLSILVANGQKIKKGDNLLVLEAMKMENNIKSPVDGIVKQVICKKDAAVDKNAVLIVFE